ncbi:ENTH domain protein [Cooperia oncophora]
MYTIPDHTIVMNYTEAENLVYEATNEDPWGPTGPQMKEIANYTFQYDSFYQVTNLLWKRMLEDNKSAWRRVYKVRVEKLFIFYSCADPRTTIS